MIALTPKNFITHISQRFLRISAIGFDISDRSIKYMKFDADGIVAITAFGETEIPSGVIENGEIKQEEELVNIIKSWRAASGKDLPPFVIASLPEEKSYLRLLQIPPMKKEEVANAIRWEIEGNIPLSPEELVFDQELSDSSEIHPDHFDVVITAFPKTIVESYTNVLLRSGLEPVALELESQAIVRAVLPRDWKMKAYVIVDMGYSRTGFAVFVGGAIVFTTTLDIGGKKLEEDIVQGLGVTNDEAIKIKKEVGLQKKAFDGKLFPLLQPALNSLVDGIRQAIEYYEHHAAHSHGASAMVDEIILTGGDANLYGLDTFLAVALRIPVTVGDPLSRLRPRLNPPVPPVQRHELLRYTGAIGLAMRMFQ